MTENTEKWVIEILCKLQNDRASMHREMRDEFREVKARLTLLEQPFAVWPPKIAGHKKAARKG